MSVTITSSSYAGEEAAKYISSALLTANTLDGGLIEIHDNVKYREVIQKLSSTGLLQDADCDFTDSGDVQLDEIVLTPNPVSDHLTVDFGNTYFMDLSFRIINSVGAEVMSGKFTSPQMKSISLAQLPEGAYVIIFETEGLFAAKKVMKQ